MSDNLKKKVWLIGTGPMAQDHARVLLDIGVDLVVIGRGEQSARTFEEAIGVKPYVGGVEKFLTQNESDHDTHIIIATGTEVLMSVLMLFQYRDFAKILIEKPGAISIEELLANRSDLEEISDRAFLAYNRRFYASVMEAERLIKEDGGLQSMHFEFTEWAHRIEPLKKAPGVKENWFFANSTHVVDLAFFMAGNPASWSCFSKSGDLSWHKKVNFSGAGITENDVIFSYQANWESAGRWGIELLTSKRRIYLKPMEGLSVQMKGTVTISEHEFDNEIDLQFKPGVHRQIESFLGSNRDQRLLALAEHFEFSADILQRMLA